MSTINEITKNNERFNELQALQEEQNSTLLPELRRMSEIHDNVARKILIGRSYEDYLNYKNTLNGDKHLEMFISDNVSIIGVTDKMVTISISEPSRSYYWRGVDKKFAGGDFTKTIPLSYFVLDDRALAKKARVNIYNYLMNIENNKVNSLHRSDLEVADKVAKLEKEIENLKVTRKYNEKFMNHHNNLRKSYELWFYNKLYGDDLPVKERGNKYPEGMENVANGETDGVGA